MKQIAGIDSNNFNVLIVDDIPLNLMLLDMMLKPFKFKIVKAFSGRDALNAIQERLNTPDHIDLAIVDLMMPNIDGYQVIEYVRNGCHNDEFNIPALSKSELPIVILSAMNLSDDVTRALNLGANQFLTKPLVQDQLFNTITHELTLKVEADNK